MTKEFDYVVVGLGGIGSAVAYWLARRAQGTVLGLEQFELEHERGASHDHSRIIRHSYHTPEYVELTKGAYLAWEALEEDVGEKLLLRTGGLDLWPEGAAIPMTDYVTSLEAGGIAFELLDAAEITRRWAQWRLPDDVRGLYQERGGIAPAMLCNRAHRRMARLHGAELREHARVTAIRTQGGEYEVAAGDVVYRCGAVVLATDAWTNSLLTQFGLELPLTVTQEQVTYWSPPDPELFSPQRFPIWIWMDEPSFYGFPVFGAPGVKAAQDVGGEEVTAETRRFQPDAAAVARVEEFLQRYLPTAIGPILYSKGCLYTMPPDRDFVVDRVPEHGRIFIALGAAHGFKFASLLGSIVADLVVEGHTQHDIRSFRIDRPVLTELNAARSFLI